MGEATNLKLNTNPVATFSWLDLKKTHKKRPVETHVFRIPGSLKKFPIKTALALNPSRIST